MNFFSIDLSLRSSGISFFKNNVLEDFCLICNKQKGLELLEANIKDIINYISIKNVRVDYIVIEGLSFNSISGSKDIISGQFWALQLFLKTYFPQTKTAIIPVTKWRCILFTKDETKQLKQAKSQLKNNKVSLKGLKGNERKLARQDNKTLTELASIKEYTWNKLDISIQEKIMLYITTNKFSIDGRYDITDSIFLGEYTKNKLTIE